MNSMLCIVLGPGPPGSQGWASSFLPLWIRPPGGISGEIRNPAGATGVPSAHRLLMCHFTNLHNIPTWRGLHCAHFPDRETEPWRVDSSPKLIQVSGRAQDRLNQDPFPGWTLGTMEPQLEPSIRRLLGTLHPVIRKLFLGTPQSSQMTPEPRGRGCHD